MDSLRLILLAIGLVILALIWLFYRPGGAGRRPGASPRDERRREPGFEPDRTRKTAPDRPEADSGDVEFAARPRQTRLLEPLPEFDDDSAGQVPADDRKESPRAPESPVSPDLPESADAADSRSSPKSPDRPAGSGAAVTDDGPDGGLIVTLYVRARGDRKISGLSLLDAAIKAGLRFGEMKIFHRRHRGETQPVFSMANITRPGYFDPAGWNLFETPGVSLFMRLPGPVSALDAWDAMQATGKRLAELLDADLLDDAQCLLTRQRSAQIREQMREFDRKVGLGS